MKIGIGVPNNDDFKMEMVGMLTLMAYNLGKNGHEMFSVSSQSPYIDKNRNAAWDNAKKAQCDWLLYLDTDTAYPGNEDILTYAINRAVSHKAEILTGVYYGGQFPYRPVVFNFTDRRGVIRQMNSVSDAPEWWDAAGGGFLLVSKKAMDAYTPDVTEELGQPWDFKFEGTKLAMREDLAFCWRMKKLGLRVLVDPSIPLIHHKKQPIGKQHFDAALIHIQNLDKVSDGIPGWMNGNELEKLGELANKSDSVIEVGSWKGRSTKVLLEHCCGPVYAVDTWNGSSNDVTRFPAEVQDVYAEFIRNVGHYPNLKVVRGRSPEIANGFDGDNADLVFIDASHDYESVKADLEAWSPHCRKILCGHDYNGAFPGVMKAVKEKFEKINLCDSLWWVEL